ncbi:universal stress protein [Psychroflexus gondwanensis]|jgi:nucleotide-binding universal stress UspA family protein|uniref:Universal stress protein, UspA family n=1 Tax=Psychroflexus gondwanensis ACAM 44 TaxID=1189619 RepID=N1WNK8_9FLAO|nr:universal stress protein [Psychroflexus gondwanensis]EMY80555.1 universal stress protein, UspA family [Psychroflexus gondwanensis ACAM 44]TXE20530.1 universal stress protein [Psychroflexus gondwanensis]
MLKILIPTDFSETAKNAIQYGLELFKHQESEFIIMHAYADEVYKNGMEMDQESFNVFKENTCLKAESQLQNEVIEFSELSPNSKHTFTYEACFGSLVDETNDSVERENIDLVIMGTKGETNNKEISFGSHTLQVIKYIKCPVLAIPTGFKETSLHTIGFATDYMLPFKKRELRLLSTLAMQLYAVIYMVFISDYKSLSRRQQDNRSFSEYCLRENKTDFIQETGKNITEGINKVLQEQNFDMLVMVNQRHSYLENLLYHSTIEKIGLQIKIPFLVLQNLNR